MPNGKLIDFASNLYYDLNKVCTEANFNNMIKQLNLSCNILTYIGNGTNNRVVSTNMTPIAALILSWGSGYSGVSGIKCMALPILNNPSTWNGTRTAEIVTNGIKLYYFNSSDLWYVNEPNKSYNCIWFA